MDHSGSKLDDSCSLKNINIRSEAFAGACVSDEKQPVPGARVFILVKEYGEGGKSDI